MGSQFAHRRSRFLILIGILAVTGLTISSFIARQRKRGHPRPLPPKIAEGVDQQTQAFSLSKSLAGQRVYTIHASQVTNFKDTGKTILRDVTIQLFGKKGDRQDHITAKECEFDQAAGTLFIPGDVEMDLQAPSQDPDPSIKVPDTGPIHVSTSMLSFNQGTGVASSDQLVRFRFRGGQGTSMGAVYNPEDHSIVLKAQARFSLWASRPGLNAGASGMDSIPATNGGTTSETGATEANATQIAAGSLRFEHGSNKILLAAPVEIVQGTRHVQGGDSEIILDENQRAQSATLRGGVHAEDRNPLQLAEIQSAQCDLEFTPEGRVRKIALDGASPAVGPTTGTSVAAEPGVSVVRWAVASAQSFKAGEARRAEMFFDGPENQLTNVKAEGQVLVLLGTLRAPAALPLLGSPLLDTAGRPRAGDGGRLLRTEQAEMFMAPDGDTLREMRTHSGSTIQLFPVKSGEDQRTVEGEDFNMQFGPSGELTEFTAERKTRFSAEGSGKNGRKRLSTSDHLWAGFDPRTHSVSRMRQWGNFQYRDPDRQARSEKADYSTDGDVIVLQEKALAWNATGNLSAAKISLFNSTGELDAENQVSTTYFPEQRPGSPPSEPVHAVADRLQYQTRTQDAVYRGHARLWQGTSLVEADSIEVNRKISQLTAREGVYSVFAGRPAAEKKKPGTGGAAALLGDDSGPIEIRADTLVYKDADRTARYQGGVRMHNTSSQMTSGGFDIQFKPPADASSTPAPSGGNMQIERAIATSKVLIVQPGRTAVGERAEYIPEENKIILTGNLAAISDAQKGSSQGARLTYFTGNDTILVQGESGSPVQTKRPVQR